ncbi:tyrosine-type recombinase/integrase [Pseudactinotalea sp. Z1739]|uniref:tyrosine-type recombinase/integrase n=1 Tax=Pseudactinotalea sp. Z1739 TaxID=3413028 RepID=UPI003C7D51D6
MSRRANGEGTLTKRKDGRWEAAAFAPTLDGPRKRIRVYARDRKAAHDKLVAKLEEIRLGIPTATTRYTVGEYMQRWLTTVAPKRVRPNSLVRYEAIARLHLIPVLGSAPLATLSTRDVQATIQILVRAGKSPSIIRQCRKLLSSALSEAVRTGLILRNPCQHVRIPTYKPKPIRPWDAEEAAAFLAATTNHRWYAGFVILLFYGLREGEVLGLRWCDIDFRHNEITLRQQLQTINGELVAVELKTDAANRTVPLVPFVREALLAHAQAQGTVLDTAHSPDVPDEYTAAGLVLLSRVGTPVFADNFLQVFKRLSKEAGVRVINVHHARHTVATFHSLLGTPPKEAQAILGHANISTTQQIYQHSDLRTRRQAVASLASHLETRIAEKTSHVATSLATAEDTDNRCRQPLPSEAPTGLPAVSVTAAAQPAPPEVETTMRPGDSAAVNADNSEAIRSPGTGTDPARDEHDPCHWALDALTYPQIMSLHVRTRRHVVGRVAVRICRQAVASPVSSGPGLSELVTLRGACKRAMRKRLRRRSFPLNLIPTIDSKETP